MNTLRKTDKQLSGLISRIGHREDGFSMISAIMALMVGTLLSLAAWATANSDINFTDKDKWSRACLPTCPERSLGLRPAHGRRLRLLEGVRQA